MVSPRLRNKNLVDCKIIVGLITYRRECRGHCSAMAEQPIIKQINSVHILEYWNSVHIMEYCFRVYVTYQLFCSWFDNTVVAVKPAGVACREK